MKSLEFKLCDITRERDSKISLIKDLRTKLETKDKELRLMIED
jgi:hypothetical protein